MSVSDIVVDILERHGDWVETSVILRDIQKELEISERHAFRYLQKAREERKIIRLKMGGDILYGLPSWALPGTSSKTQEDVLTFEDAFKYRCFKRIEEISNDNAEKDSMVAWLKMRSLIMSLPPTLKEKIKPHFIKAEKSFLKRRRELEPSHILVGAPEVDYLIDKVSSLLHQMDRKTTQ
jgi:hypothetical protein